MMKNSKLVPLKKMEIVTGKKESRDLVYSYLDFKFKLHRLGDNTEGKAMYRLTALNFNPKLLKSYSIKNTHLEGACTLQLNDAKEDLLTIFNAVVEVKMKKELARLAYEKALKDGTLPVKEEVVVAPKKENPYKKDYSKGKDFKKNSFSRDDRNKDSRGNDSRSNSFSRDNRNKDSRSNDSRSNSFSRDDRNKDSRGTDSRSNSFSRDNRSKDSRGNDSRSNSFSRDNRSKDSRGNDSRSNSFSRDNRSKDSRGNDSRSNSFSRDNRNKDSRSNDSRSNSFSRDDRNKDSRSSSFSKDNRNFKSKPKSNGFSKNKPSYAKKR